MTQKTIFLSHSSDDNPFTQQLARRFESVGFDVWVDLDDLVSGERWLRSIQTGLENSHAVVVVMSRAARQSEWVERETLLALQLRKPLFIAYVDDTPLPLHLIDRQYSDFRKDFEAGFQHLLQPLQAALAMDKQTPAEKHPLPAEVSADPNEDNFFKYLAQMDDGEAMALIARDLYLWAGDHADDIAFGGRHTPCFHIRVKIEDKYVTVASLLAYISNPALQIPFDYLKKYAPFTQATMRLKTLRTLNNLLPQTAQFADDRANGRPTMALIPIMNDADRLEKIKDLLATIIIQLRKADA